MSAMAPDPQHLSILEAPLRRLFNEVTRRFPELHLDSETVSPNAAAFRMKSERGDFAVRVEGSENDPRGGPGLLSTVNIVFPDDYVFPEGTNEQTLRLDVTLEMISPGSGTQSPGKALLITHENFPHLLASVLRQDCRPWQLLVSKLENVSPTTTMPSVIVDKLMELRREATARTGGRMA